MALAAAENLGILVVVFISFVHLGSRAEIAIEYLSGGPRLNSISYQDYYFCCNVEGQFVQMFANGFSVGGFSSQQSGFVLTGTETDFSYTTTLISVEDRSGGNFQYDSIIVISVTQQTDIEVTCESNLGSDRANNTGSAVAQYSQNRTHPSGQLMLQQIFSGQIIQGSNEMKTHGFICGVDQNFQALAVGEDQNEFLFDSRNAIGLAVPRPSRGDPSTVYRLAFLCAKDPFTIVTALFVTGDLNVTVTCSAGIYIADLRIEDLSIPRPSVSTSSSSEEPTLKLPSSLESQKSSPTPPMSSPPSTARHSDHTVTYAVIGVVCACVLGLLGLIIILFVAIGYVHKRNEKRIGVKQNLNDGRSDHPLEKGRQGSLEKDSIYV